MMNQSHSKTVLAFWFSYLVNGALALYFAKGVKTLHPPQFLVLALLAGGLLLGFLFFAIFKKREGVESKASQLLSFGAFQLTQAILGFVLGHFVFNLSLISSCAYPLGAAAGFAIYWILSQ